jgi:hypothetical protein
MFLIRFAVAILLGAATAGAYVAFVSALNPSGTALLYSTYLSGSSMGAGR